MAKSRKAEKRQKRKEKKDLLKQTEIQKHKVKFDVISLLESENLDTKPNIAKFLKEYVQAIVCFNNGKIKFYPSFKYQLSKVFVKFLDGHELIYDMMTDGKIVPKYYMYYMLDELELKVHDMTITEQFFQNLFKFKFIF